MRTLVASPGTGSYAQQVALSFLERGDLEAFVTTFVHRPEGGLAKLVPMIPSPLGPALLRQLQRRTVPLLPDACVRAHPMWEIARTAMSQSGFGPVMVDRVWDRMARSFDRIVAERHLRGVDAVYAYEYSALATLRRAKSEGITAILDLPSLDSRTFETLLRGEKAKFPELRGEHDAYFERKFEERQARRDAEIAEADLIVVNSTLTKRSHVESGADAAKIAVVPLAAPETVAAVEARFDASRPLRAAWAGTFSIRKGAHYFLEAWGQLQAGAAAEAHVYGALDLPASALKSPPAGVAFHGSVPRAELFEGLDRADILVFPTLSDGFGMVVTEAFARGVPVIATDRAGASDLVRHGENGLIVPAGDAAALADALRWCLDNRARLHEMRFAALETARGWQWPDYRRRLVEIIHEHLGKSAPASHARLAASG
jgi:glycosyltransferase involved in cell wall biosynthesis